MSSMIPPPIPSLHVPAIPPEPVWRLTVKHYHDMIHTGILNDDDPVELLEGWLVPKMPKNPPHVLANALLGETLGQLLPAGWFVNSQDPVTTLDSEPEPDISVIRGTRRDYLDRHPGPEDVGLLVEIADTTLARDRGIKKTLYARANIPVYWIVDLAARQVEVYSDPTGPCDEPGYRQQRVYGANDFLPVVLDGQEIGQLNIKQALP